MENISDLNCPPSSQGNAGATYDLCSHTHLRRQLHAERQSERENQHIQAVCSRRTADQPQCETCGRDILPGRESSSTHGM